MRPIALARAFACASAAFVAAPSEARFLQVDPVGYDDQINLYTYVGNDPTNQTDPTGACPSCVGAFIGGGLEVYDQIQSGEASRTISNVQSAWGRGDVLGAISAAGPSLGKIVISAGAGALGGGLAAGAEKAAVGQLAKTGAVTAIGSGTNAAGQVGKNAVDGRALGDGTGRAAAAGALGAAGGRALGQAAEKRVFQSGVAKISPGATPGSRALATHDAREASRQAANRTANSVNVGVGAANSAKCLENRCQ